MLLGIKYVFMSCPTKIILLIVILCVQGFFPAFNVYTTGKIISSIQMQSQDTSFFLTNIALWCFSLLGVQCLQPIVNLIQGDVNEITTRYFNENIMNRMNSAITLTLFENKKKHEQLELLRREAAYRPLNFIVTMVFLVRSIIMVGGLLYILISYSGIGPALCAFSVIPMLFINIKVEQKNWRNLLQLSRESLIMRYVFDACMDKGHLQEIRLYNIGNLMLDKYSKAAQKLHESMHKQRLNALFSPLPMILLSLIILFFGVYIFLDSLRSSNLGISATVVAFQSVVMLKSHLDDMAANGGHIFSLTGFFKVYDEFMHGFNEPVSNGSVIIPGGEAIALSISNLSFSYEESDKKAIDDLSLNIKKGEKIAILGDNGSGKTTLIKILLRMYACENDKIKINGIPLEDMDIISFRERVSTVFQEYGKYEFSVAENISFSECYSSDIEERLQGLLKKVELKLSPSDQLGKRFGGSDLSVGQWQKLSIARAMNRSADLFIFDEFSSSLDPEIEYKLFNEILSIKATIIAVTHRLGKIKEFDRIIIMDSGKIIENGTFEELIELRGKFYSMWQAQFKSILEEK